MSYLYVSLASRSDEDQSYKAEMIVMTLDRYMLRTSLLVRICRKSDDVLIYADSLEIRPN
jgi:hypothetical protein